jgi:uncharacterized cupin superfamily protein
MQKLNVDDLPWHAFVSPGGKFTGASREISVALGAPRHAAPSAGGHPFDLSLERMMPGSIYCPFHRHAAQWEMFYILAGSGTVRTGDGRFPVRPGDTLLHPPGDAHQLINTGDVELVYLIIADNPLIDVCEYPDSGKLGVFAQPMVDRLLRGHDVDYWEGEE